MNAAAALAKLMCGLLLAGTALAADEETDAELLEYLGSWTGADDEWHEFFDSLPPELVEAAEEDTHDGSTEDDAD